MTDNPQELALIILRKEQELKSREFKTLKSVQFRTLHDDKRLKEVRDRLIFVNNRIDTLEKQAGR